MKTIHHEQFSIREIRCKILKPISLPRPFYDASMGPFTAYQTSILTLVDESGVEGEVEFPVAGIPLLKQIFAPILLELQGAFYPEIYKSMFWHIRNEGFRGAAALALGHLDRAFYDIASRRKLQPLHQYLGATRNWVNLYASGGSTGLTDDELIEECLGYKEDGYTVIKIKAGGDFASHLHADVKRIEKVRDALGSNIRLAVDTNQAMTVPQALDFAERIEDLNIDWLEEPLHSADIIGMEQLSKQTTMRISYGESERTKHLFPLMVKAGITHLQPVANNMISIDEWSNVCDLATKHDLMLSCGSLPGVNAQLIATQKEDAMCEYLIPYLKSIEQYFQIIPTFKNGKAFLPDIEGISIRFNWNKIKQENMIEESFKIKRQFVKN